MESTYNKRYFKFFIFLLAVAIILPVFASIEFPKIKKTYAVNENIKFDETAVLDDLAGSTINGKTFNISDYPKDPRGSLKAVAFVEYCYSFYAGEMQQNYGLYIYIYNPALLALSENVGQNKIQIANKFDNNGSPTDWKRHPADYSKFNLQFCSVSDGDNYKLFYKYKVVDNNFKLFENVRLYEEKHSGIRRYYVSGVELLEDGRYTAIDYTIGTMFEFSGYANGYGPGLSNDFPLQAKTEPLEVAELDVQSTFFRSESSNKGVGYQNQLDSVYFGVDNRFFELYGELQKIKSEWYEYKTKEIVVTKNMDFYNRALPYLGTYIPWGQYNSSVKYMLALNYSGSGEFKGAEWAWNIGTWALTPTCETLYYLFPTNDIDNYDPYSKTIGGVGGNDLYNFIKAESLKYSNYLPDVKEGNKLSSNMFLDTVDSGRTRGYNFSTIDARIDLQAMISYQDGNPSFWDNVKNYNFWKAITGSGIPQESGYTLQPIYIVTDEDMALSDIALVQKLKINVNSVNAFRNYYDAQKAAKKQTVLFRFAVTDYYSRKITILEPRGVGYPSEIDNQAYMAQETCFFDFDILTLTFVKEKVETIIPCVSSPIDIVDAITPPVDFGSGCVGDFWNTLLIIGLILLIFFLLFILSPVLPSIVAGAVAIVKLPFKAGSAVVNSFKKDKYKKQQKHYSKSGRKNYKRKKRY